MSLACFEVKIVLLNFKFWSKHVFKRTSRYCPTVVYDLQDHVCMQLIIKNQFVCVAVAVAVVYNL